METEKTHRRAEARKTQNLNHFNHVFAETLGLDEDSNLNLIGTILGLLVRRLGPNEAAHFTSQLPEAWKELCLNQPAGPDRSITADAVIETIGAMLDLDFDEARDVLVQFWECLSSLVTPGELDQVLAQLPRDYQEFIAGEGLNNGNLFQ